MANRQARSMGALAKFDDKATVPGTVPAIPQNDGSAYAAASRAFDGLGDQLGRMANRAAAREGQAEAWADLAKSQVREAPPPQSGKEAPAAPAETGGADGVGFVIDEAARRHGENPDTLRRFAQLESRMNPNAKNPGSSAGGLFQFTDGTARDYGLKNKFDPAASADAAARLLADNRAALRQALGRDPTEAELYLAHQQGAGGAIKLLTNPLEKASNLVGADAVRLNVPKAYNADTMTAQQFINLWSQKFERQPDVAGGSAPQLQEGARQEYQPPPPPAPIQLRRNGTIRGEAYDDVMQQAGLWRFVNGARTAIGAAYETYKDDPDQLNAAIAEVKQGYGAKLSDPEMRVRFDAQLDEQAAPYTRAARANRQQRQHAEFEASARDGLAGLTQDLQRQAYLIGVNADGDELLGQQFARADAAVEHAYAEGAISPAERVKYRRDIREGIISERVRGIFDALDTPEKKANFAAGLVDAWKSGEGPIATLDREHVAALSDRLLAQVRREKTARNAELSFRRASTEKMLDDDVVSIRMTGEPLSIDGQNLDAADVAKVVGVDKATAWLQKRDQAKAFHAATYDLGILPEDKILDRLDTLDPEPGTPGFKDAQRLHDDVEKEAKRVLKLRRTDPAAAVDESFATVRSAREGLDETRPETFAALADARLNAQAALGIPETARDPLTNSEARAIMEPVLKAAPGKEYDALREVLQGVELRYGEHAEDVAGQLLRQTGVDRDMSAWGMRTLREIDAAGRPTRSTARTGDVLTDTKAAKDAMGGAPARKVFPTEQQIEMLVARPDLAPQFDKKFGQGASRLYLQTQPPIPDRGATTFNADGSENWEP